MDSANLVFNSSTSKYDVTVPKASFGPMGIEYYFKASDAVPNIARSPQAGSYYSYISLTSTNPQIPGGLIGVGGALGNWKIITIPYLLSDSKIATVFSELGAVDNSKWRLITLKSQTAWGQYPTDFTNFTQGKGYFINIKDVPSTGLVIEGATTPTNNQTNPFKLTLDAGWTEIGNPYSFPIKWKIGRASCRERV